MYGYLILGSNIRADGDEQYYDITILMITVHFMFR